MSGPIWAYLVQYCAIGPQSMQSGYARIPASFDDSVRVLGAGDPGLLRLVHWTVLRLSTALLVLVHVMKAMPATLVLRPFNANTLAVVAYQLARDKCLVEAALPSLALVLVWLIPVMLLSPTLCAP